MAIQVSGTSVISDGRLIQNLNGLIIPSGNTASRPGSPAEGQIYHNTETDEFEVYASILVPAAYATLYQGVVNGNNAIFMASRIAAGYNPPSGTATPLALDTSFGIIMKTNERLASTDGKEHRITATYNIGAGSTSGGYYYNGFGGTKTLPADGSEVSVGAVAFTFIGLSGGSMSGGSAMKLEVLNPATNVGGWRKVGAY